MNFIQAIKRLTIFYILKYCPSWEKWRIENNIFKVSQLNEKTGKLKVRGFYYLRRRIK